MNIRRRSLVAVAVAVMTVLALLRTASAGDPPIQGGGATTLPDYVGTPVKAHPTANSGVPQNQLLAPNGFNSCHLDPWMSDTADIAGALGRRPSILSSTFASARKNPLPNPNDGPDWLFECITHMFDSHGRLLTLCFAPHEATAVLADPETLEVLAHYELDVPPPPVYTEVNPGELPIMRSILSSYSYFDARDQLHVSAGGNDIVTVQVTDGLGGPKLEHRGTYNLKSLIPGDDNRLAGVMADEQGRIWMTTVGTTQGPAGVGVLNPAKCSYEDPKVNWYWFPMGEVIRNTFPVDKINGNRSLAYIATSQQMYRIEAGPDDVPVMVWSEPYDTTGQLKKGQYELGTGTSPTVLGEGRYVAITDNAEKMKVVVFRTDAKLGPKEERKVCAVEVFKGQAGQSSSNSLTGFRLSLIATNNYNYYWDWQQGKLITPSAPGAERIDIDPNGKGCHVVWENKELMTTTSQRLSTKTGLIYTVSHEYDTVNKLHAYYWVALDFRTGKTVWKKLAGTGDRFDTFYPALAIGPNGALYAGVYGGLIMMKDGK